MQTPQSNPQWVRPPQCHAAPLERSKEATSLLILFIISMAAMLTSWEKHISWSSIGFHFRDVSALTDRKPTTRVTYSHFIASLSAEDLTLAFYSRSVLE